MFAVRAIQSRVTSLPIVFSRSATAVLSPLEQKYFPHIGNREIVGYGRSGALVYYDDKAYPYPAIRFRNHDDTIEALRQKEQGPWNNLTLDEVKTLYRHSFCRTLEEAHAPHGMWKLGLAWGMMICTVGCLFFIYIKTVLVEIPVNVLQLPEYKEAVKYKRVFSRGGSIKQKYDFDVRTRRFRE